MIHTPQKYFAKEDALRIDQSWYGWDSEEPDSGWLLTYVDVLSVILAMMVILLGRMAVDQLPSATEYQEQAPESMSVVETVASSTNLDDHVEALPNRELPIQTPATISKEEQFSELMAQRFRGEVDTVQHDNGVSIVIPDVVLFESARANLEDTARPMLARLAASLQEIGEASISVEGHSDDRPIQGGEFSSNWELAAARATTVTRFLLSQGLAEGRLRAVSYGQSRPIGDNSTPEGQTVNRRVELRVEFLESPEVVGVVDVDAQGSLRDRSERSL